MSEDELREQIEELETQLSSAVSARDLTIRDLRAEVELLRGMLRDAPERARVAEEIAAWLREGNVGPLNRVVIRENAAQEIERRWGYRSLDNNNLRETNVRKRRLRACVNSWPECETGKYDPRCCRFPKSCSCTVYDPEKVKPSDLEQDR